MDIENLKLAVKCCTIKDGTWEATCGLCPFNYLLKNGDIFNASNCIDKLILALADYLPKEGK